MIRTKEMNASEQFSERIRNGEILVETSPGSGADYNSQESKVLDIYKINFASSKMINEIIDSFDVREKKDFNEFIKNDFKVEVIVERLNTMYNYMLKFIAMYESSDMEKKIFINTVALEKAISSYFIDVKRLKNFHDINKTNIAKVYGYMGYWLLKTMPIQVDTREVNRVFLDQEDSEIYNKISSINEKFIVSYILNGILTEISVNINDAENIDSFKEFAKLLLYALKYREITAKCLELMISSFIAGFSLNAGIR